MRNGADLLCRVLERHGIACAFGLPGTQTVALHEALRRSRIRTVVATHELAASFMANGYYRASGRVAPLVTIPGPGFTYALTGLAEARHDSCALLHLVGRPSGTDPRRCFQALDQRALAAPLVKGARRIDRAEQIEAVVAESLELALGGEPGPVVVECAAAALEGTAHVAARLPPSAPAPLDLEGVDRAVRLLTSSRRPLVLAGQGCAGAPEPLRELAERLGAPVVTSASGRGVLAEDHPLAIGFDHARGTPETLRELVQSADAVLAIGCRLGADSAMGLRVDVPPERLVHVDASTDTLGAGPGAWVALVAPAEGFLVEAVARVRRLRAPDETAWPPSEIAAWRRRARLGASEPEPLVRGARPPTAAAFFTALRAALPRDGLVVADSGLHQTLLRRHFDVYASRGLVFPSNFQSMGFGLPAAIGARLAAPTRCVVALIGDGGFAMSGMELLTAVRERIPVTVIVLADGALNRIRLDQLARYGRPAHVELLNPDFEAFAAAAGAQYLRCEGDAESVLRHAIGSGEVTLVEVPLGDSDAIRRARIRGLAKSAARRALGPGPLAVLKRALRACWGFTRMRVSSSE